MSPLAPGPPLDCFCIGFLSCSGKRAQAPCLIPPEGLVPTQSSRHSGVTVTLPSEGFRKLIQLCCCTVLWCWYNIRHTGTSSLGQKMMPWHKTGIRWSVAISPVTSWNVLMGFLKIQGQMLPWRLRIAGLVVDLASVGLTVRPSQYEKTKDYDPKEVRRERVVESVLLNPNSSIPCSSPSRSARFLSQLHYLVSRNPPILL